MLYGCSAMLWFMGFDREIVPLSSLIGAVLAAVIFGVWLMALLPLALFVPSRSLFWSRRVLAPVGFFIGLGICTAVVFWNALRNENDWPPEMYDWRVNFMNVFEIVGPPSAIIGLVTGLSGAFFHRRECLASSSDDVSAMSERAAQKP